MPLISTQIEIAASPEKVRNTFLEFSTYPEWSHGFIQSIENLSKPGITPGEGDKLKVVLPGMTFEPSVLVNTPEELTWRGSLPYIFTGDHTFKFQPSTTTPAGTTFLQYENFTGLLSPLMSLPIGLGKTTGPGFQKFNEDLKRRCEGEA